MDKSLEQQKYEQALDQIYEANIKAHIVEVSNTIHYAKICIDFLEETKDVRFLPIIKNLHNIINEANLMITIYNSKLKGGDCHE